MEKISRNWQKRFHILYFGNTSIGGAALTTLVSQRITIFSNFTSFSLPGTCQNTSFVKKFQITYRNQEVGKCHHLLVCNEYLCEYFFLKTLGYHTVEPVLHVWSTVLKKKRKGFPQINFQ